MKRKRSNKDDGSNTTGLTVDEVIIQGNKRDGMTSIVCHYNPTLVAQALSSYAQPAHWAKAP